MKPRSLMFTLYGDFIQYYGGEIWIGSLIRMMAEFGISESSVRGATLRMVQQDLLQVRRVGNKSYYSLTEKGKRRIEDGVRSIFDQKPQVGRFLANFNVFHAGGKTRLEKPGSQGIKLDRIRDDFQQHLGKPQPLGKTNIGNDRNL